VCFGLAQDLRCVEILANLGSLLGRNVVLFLNLLFLELLEENFDFGDGICEMHVLFAKHSFNKRF
jgi:hypothetical protein